ncbi:MAG: N-acetylmuramoyl-L-alanine amidase [Candidatus Omnitrophota bacterium]
MKKQAIFLNLLLIFILASCARAPISHTIDMKHVESYPALTEHMGIDMPMIRTDVYHEVAPGETVWRIGQMYDVNTDDIKKANRLWDINKLEKGQKLLIPNAAPLRSVISFYPSNKWKYIIIHHSATDVGKALSFDYIHSNKKKWKGLGYHFVIDNGTSGKKDGHIEVSPRWLHQEDGAHCKAGNMNSRGIGVCLVGNFSKDAVSSRQMESLVSLVKELKKRYNIPDSNILGHSDVKGASTECPGLKFPWRDFRYKLKSY